MKSYKYSRKVNYYETDKMAIVHHTNYIRYFEEARLDSMEQAGLDYAEVESHGIIIPVVDVYAKYYKSLEYGDEFEVETLMVKFTGVKLEYEYKIYNKNTGELSATGHSCHCFLANANGFPVNIKKHVPELYERFRAILDTDKK